MNDRRRAELIGRVQGVQPRRGTQNGLYFVAENVTYFPTDEAQRQGAQRIILDGYKDTETYYHCQRLRGVSRDEAAAVLAAMYKEQTGKYTAPTGQYLFYGDATGLEEGNEA